MGFTDDVTESDGQGSSTRVQASHSRFVQRVRRRYAAELPLLAPGIPRGEHIAELIDALLAGGRSPASISCTASRSSVR